MSLDSIINQFSSDRTFGIELEFFGITRNDVETALTNAGIACYLDDSDSECDNEDCDDQGYCSCGSVERRLSGWKVTSDGSIRANGGGYVGFDMDVELVSPILSGQEGLREVARVAEIVSAAGAQVNRTCGFHVHLGANDLSGEVFLNLVKRYALHEDAIDAFMPESRRGNANEYCRSVQRLLRLTEGHRQGVSMDQVAQNFDGGRTARGEYLGYDSGGRYFKLNLCAFLAHGTVEFRHHGGTVNPEKIVNWIIFCQNFVQNSLDSDSRNPFIGLPEETVTFFARRASEMT